MKRVQRVVVRSKVKRQRWARLQKLGVGTFFIGGAMILAGVGWLFAQRFLFQSNYFSVKSVKVEPDSPVKAELAKRLARLRGRSIFSFSAARLESDLMRTHPEFQAADVSRSLPDEVRVRTLFRRPIAAVRFNGESQWTDAAGVLFSLPAELTPREALPELAIHSLSDVAPLVAFVARWHAKAKGKAPEINKFALDPSGEVNLYYEDPASFEVRVVWGSPADEVFEEKLRRFLDVKADLARKAMKVKYVNLRGVPQNNPPVLGNRQIVGRVIVRPIQETARRPGDAPEGSVQ